MARSEQVQDQRRLRVVHFDHGGQLHRFFEDLGRVEGLAQIHVEDANAGGGGLGSERLDGLTRLLVALRQRTEADGVGTLDELHPSIRKLQKIPRRGLVNCVARLAVFETDGYAAGFVLRIDLKESCFDGHWSDRIQAVDGLAAQVIAADAAQDCGVIAEPGGHHGEVGGCTAQPLPIGHNVPKQFADSEDQMRFFHVKSRE